jgi:hypothetical protein
MTVMYWSPAAAQSVSPDRLVAAAKSARLSQIDDRRDACGDDRTVGDWLREVTGVTARSVRWQGGRCVLARKENAIDSGTNWCAHAVVTPKRGGKGATIEVYFEKPVRGRPGTPFAFRSNVFTAGSWDYGRFTRDFEMNWRSTFDPGFTPPDEECD